MKDTRTHTRARSHIHTRARTVLSYIILITTYTYYLFPADKSQELTDLKIKFDEKVQSLKD